jgi:hypothetical protein
MSKKTENKDTKKSVRVINEDEEKALLNFINDIPTKYGLPLMKFLEGLENIKQ